jgi:hypothetical protein
MKNNNTYNAGIADVWYSGTVADAWIEYKYTKKLPPVINLLDRKKPYALTALQEKWLRERCDEGRNVFVVLGCPFGGVIFKGRQWEKTHVVGVVKVASRQAVAEWIAILTEGKYEAPVRSRKDIERCV